MTPEKWQAKLARWFIICAVTYLAATAAMIVWLPTWVAIGFQAVGEVLVAGMFLFHNHRRD